jgi:hypothetical protein
MQIEREGTQWVNLEGVVRSIRILKLALGVASLSAVAFGQGKDSGEFIGGIATWSAQTNTPQWDQALGVRYTRQGCSHEPAECMRFIAKVASRENVKVTLHMPLNATTTAAYAREYSKLSLDAPYLVEVSIDDFVSEFRAFARSGSNQPAEVVREVIGNLKSLNRKLRFGATIYEDDLGGPYLEDASLPAAVRARFDYIHLFIHYREDGLNYSAYVREAKRLFPHARIIAGAYAYDRRAFLPCAPNGQPCTAQQDIELFRQSLIIQAQEVKHGHVDHIEFYPGYFGAEEQWPSWNNPRECAPGDVDACVAHTKAMRQAVLNILERPAIRQ